MDIRLIPVSQIYLLPCPSHRRELEHLFAAFSRAEPGGGLVNLDGRQASPTEAPEATSNIAKVEKTHPRRDVGAHDEAKLDRDPLEQLMESCTDWENPDHPISAKFRYTVTTTDSLARSSSSHVSMHHLHSCCFLPSISAGRLLRLWKG